MLLASQQICVYAKAVIIAALVLIVISCKSGNVSPGTADKQGADSGKSVAAQPVGDSSVFKIVSVELTQKEQKFFEGIQNTGEPLVVRRKPRKGHSYVIVTFTLNLASGGVKFDSKKDLHLDNSPGCNEPFPIEEDTWVPCESTTEDKVSNGTSKRLYYLPANKIQAAKLRFADKEYPIDQFLNKPTSPQ